jgi:hypothetical protein
LSWFLCSCSIRLGLSTTQFSNKYIASQKFLYNHTSMPSSCSIFWLFIATRLPSASSWFYCNTMHLCKNTILYQYILEYSGSQPSLLGPWLSNAVHLWWHLLIWSDVLSERAFTIFTSFKSTFYNQKLNKIWSSILQKYVSSRHSFFSHGNKTHRLRSIVWLGTFWPTVFLFFELHHQFSLSADRLKSLSCHGYVLFLIRIY